MSQYWESLASRTEGQYTPEDFESAAYRLVTEQVIYHSDLHSRTAYGAVDRYERDFKEALLPLGVDVQVNRQLRYAYARPRHVKAGTATVAQTLFALVLRALYDESARAGQMTDDGDVICDLVELEEKYRLMTGRDLTFRGEFDALMRTMKRWGIARKSDELAMPPPEDDSAKPPYSIYIRPAIADILGETAMLRLAQWAPGSSELASAAEDEAVDHQPEAQSVEQES
jgi:hypothetical protein